MIFKPVDIDKDPFVPSSVILALIGTGALLTGTGNLLFAAGLSFYGSSGAVPFLGTVGATIVGAQCAYYTIYYAIESARRAIKAAFADNSPPPDTSRETQMALTYPKGLSMTIQPEMALFAALRQSQQNHNPLGCEDDKAAVRAFLQVAKSRPAPYVQPGSTLNLENERIRAVWQECLAAHSAMKPHVLVHARRRAQHPSASPRL